LSDWSEWTECSKACDGGTIRRTKSIAVPAKGQGECWEAVDKLRLEFMKCNENSCVDTLAAINGENGTRTILKCASQVDVTLVVDGSGSLNYYGWWQTKQLMKALITNFNNNSNAQVAVILFSGPENFPDYEACTQNASSVDMERQCKVKQVTHYTDNTDFLAMTVNDLAWPQGSTLTSVALGMAEAELRYGRPTAQSKVVVITDGQPMSHLNTKAAAKRLQEKADVIWVPIGLSAPVEFVKELASLPQEEHVIVVDMFEQLHQSKAFNGLVNKIITTTCPEVA